MNSIIDILKNTVAMLISIGVIGIIAFVMRETLKRYIDHYFTMKEVEIKHGNDIDSDLKRNYVPIYSEIGNIIYNLRCFARDLSQTQYPLERNVSRYVESCEILRERIGRYRTLLHGDLYEKIHLYKRQNQEFSILLDIATREEELRKNKAMYSEEVQGKLKQKYNDIENLYKSIVMEMQDNLGITQPKVG